MKTYYAVILYCFVISTILYYATRLFSPLKTKKIAFLLHIVHRLGTKETRRIVFKIYITNHFLNHLQVEMEEWGRGGGGSMPQSRLQFEHILVGLGFVIR
jgi:hypothetical protein